MSGRIGRVGLEAGVVAAAFALWGVLSAGSESIYFPPLSRILDRFAENWLFERVGTDLVPSLERLGIGYALATVLGITVGVALGLAPVARRAVQPVLEFLRAMPPPALIPFALLVFGIDNDQKVFIIVLGCVWPILLSAMDGAASIDYITRDTADVYDLRGLRRVWRVVLPASAPRIAAGMRTSLSLGVILMVVSEMVGSTDGVGYFIVQAQRSFAIADMWSGILLLALLGYVLNLVFELGESRLLRWHRARSAGPTRPRAGLRRRAVPSS